VEDVAEDGGVEDLDADVAVQQGGDGAGDEGDGVAQGLEGVGGVGDAWPVFS